MLHVAIIKWLCLSKLFLFFLYQKKSLQIIKMVTYYILFSNYYIGSCTV